MTMNLSQTKKALTDAVESVHDANRAIDYFGGHGDEPAMKAIFAKMQMLRKAVQAFDNKHGTKL